MWFCDSSGGSCLFDYRSEFCPELIVILILPISLPKDAGEQSVIACSSWDISGHTKQLLFGQEEVGNRLKSSSCKNLTQVILSPSREVLEDLLLTYC